MQRSYLATLAAIAVLVLVVGLVLRDRLLRADEQRPAPPSEASALQQFSQEAQLRRTAAYFYERVEAVAPLVEFVRASAASGVRWSGDSVVTTFAGRAVALVVGDSSRALGPVPALGVDSARRDWVLVVGRRDDGRVIWTHGIAGGLAPVRCEGLETRELVLGLALPEGMAGAGVFDLTGRTVGVVVRCAGRLVVLPAREVRRLLSEASPLPGPLWAAFGFAVVPLDSNTRIFFASDSGLLVSATRLGGPADLAGLRPGDLLLDAGGRAARVELIDSVALDPAANSLKVVRRRGRVRSAVTLVRTDTSVHSDDGPVPLRGIRFMSERPATRRGAPVVTVGKGTTAAAAGLQPGDVVRFVNGDAVTSTAAADRLLSRVRGRPAFLVFERDSVWRGVLLPP